MIRVKVCGVTRPVVGHLRQEAGVDLVDDVEDSREQSPEHRDGPHLQRFRQQRVIGVGHGLAGNGPGRVPVEHVIVDDGSTDQTVEVAKANGVDHIVSFSNNQGLARGFMAGLDTCIKLEADVIDFIEKKVAELKNDDKHTG